MGGEEERGRGRTPEGWQELDTRVTESMVKSEFSVPRGRNVSISTTDDDSKIW